jgi:hypothetical protein
VGMRLTFEGDERELESAQKIWAAQVLAALEYLVHSHSVDNKDDEVDMPSLASQQLFARCLPKFGLKLTCKSDTKNNNTQASQAT